MMGMTTLKAQVEEAAKEVGDDPQSIVCFWHPRKGEIVEGVFAQLPTREFDAGYGSCEGDPFIGFTEKHVYICGTYDGAEWVQAVPRHPDVVRETKDLPVVGGG